MSSPYVPPPFPPNVPPPYPAMPPPTRTSGLAIAGFVCSFFCGVVGLILSIIGYRECRRSGGTITGEGLALAGIIISSVFLVAGILVAAAIPSFLKYIERAEAIEANLTLIQLEVAVQRYAANNGAFPTASAPATPATPCCASAGGECFDPDAWSAPAWKQLDFAIDGSHKFQYSYQSDGKTFTARAVGDPECDGDPVTLELHGKLGDHDFQISGPLGDN